MFERTTELAESMGHPPDLVVRPVESVQVELLYLNSLVEAQRVEDRLLGRLVAAGTAPDASRLLSWLREHLWVGEIKPVNSLEDGCHALTDGKALLCRPDGALFAADVEGGEHRQPEEPISEPIIRGPRDGFVEVLQTNIGLLRRRLRDPQFRVEALRVGERSRTKVVLVYHAALASPAILQEIRRRVQRVSTDGIQVGGQLEQWIEESPWSPYPQLQTTERPDKVAAALLEGRVGILVEGTPFALIAPAVLVSFFQSVEDYSHRWLAGTALRFVRMGALAVSTLAPSLYVATTMFNPELMPLKLALSLAASREGIPFPIVVEALIMESMVELLREAGIRMPKPLGGALGIVGGLVMGDIAIKAGIVSPIMVIVVGLTALGSFAIPNYEAALSMRMLRFPMVLITGLFGITGMLIFLLVLFAHLCTLRSFGVPYLSPLGQLSYREWADTLIRAPLRYLIRRPGTYAGNQGQRADPTSRRNSDS